MVAGHTSMATRGATISLDCGLVPAPCPAPAPDTPEILSAIMTISSPHLTSLKTEAAPPPAPPPLLTSGYYHAQFVRAGLKMKVRQKLLEEAAAATGCEEEDWDGKTDGVSRHTIQFPGSLQKPLLL